MNVVNSNMEQTLWYFSFKLSVQIEDIYLGMSAGCRVLIKQIEGLKTLHKRLKPVLTSIRVTFLDLHVYDLERCFTELTLILTVMEDWER